MKIRITIIKVISLVMLIGLFSFTEEQKVNIFMIGDSTMAGRKAESYPASGWGDGLKSFVGENAVVENFAVCGRSTKSYLASDKWKKVCEAIRPGDYVIVQFGHNDEKVEEKLHTDPYTTFKENMKIFIDSVKSKGATPIVCTSVVRRHFDKDGNLKNTHGDYIQATREIATETETSLVDMEALTRNLVVGFGCEKSKLLFMMFEADKYTGAFSEGSKDSTHLTVYGAQEFALLFVEDAKEQKLSIAKYFK